MLGHIVPYAVCVLFAAAVLAVACCLVYGLRR